MESKGIKHKGKQQKTVLSAEETWQLLVDLGATRGKIPDSHWDLSGVDLSGKDLTGAELRQCNLSNANLTGATLKDANLRRANLFRAILTKCALPDANLSKAFILGADLRKSNLRGADLSYSNLTGANLSNSSMVNANLSHTDIIGANLQEADLTGADLSNSILINVNITKTRLDRAIVFGTTFADFTATQSTKTSDLVVSGTNQPLITIDDITAARFVYSVINRKNRPDFYDPMAVLVLSCSAEASQAMHNALKNAIALIGLRPLMFDFNSPYVSMKIVSKLALLSRFTVVDLNGISPQLYRLPELVKATPAPFAAIADTETSTSALPDELHAYYWYKDGVLRYSAKAMADDILSILTTELLPWAEQTATELKEPGLRQHV